MKNTHINKPATRNVYGRDLLVVAFDEFQYNYAPGKKVTRTKETLQYIVGSLDIKNSDDPHNQLAFLAVDNLCKYLGYQTVEDTFKDATLVRFLLKKGMYCFVNYQMHNHLVLQNKDYFSHPLVSQFSNTNPIYYYDRYTRRQELRDHFEIAFPHKRWKKYHQLEPLIDIQRYEIAYYVNVNLWSMAYNEEHLKKFHTKYQVRYDYDNIAAYIVPDTAKTNARGLITSDLIPVPQESYHDLLVDIDKVGKAMGRFFTRASAPLALMGKLDEPTRRELPLGKDKVLVRAR